MSADSNDTDKLYGTAWGTVLSRPVYAGVEF